MKLLLPIIFIFVAGLNIGIAIYKWIGGEEQFQNICGWTCAILMACAAMCSR